MNAGHQLERISFHEAAHATIQHHFGIPVLSVEIGGGSGHCTLASSFEVESDERTNRELLRREVGYRLVMGLCAGWAAMRRWPDQQDRGCSDDRKQAHAICLKLSGDDEAEADLLLEWLSHRAPLDLLDGTGCRFTSLHLRYWNTVH